VSPLFKKADATKRRRGRTITRRHRFRVKCAEPREVRRCAVCAAAEHHAECRLGNAIDVQANWSGMPSFSISIFVPVQGPMPLSNNGQGYPT